MNHTMPLMLCAHRTITCAYCAVYFTPVLVYSSCVIACVRPPFLVDGGRARSSLLLRSVDHYTSRPLRRARARRTGTPLPKESSLSTLSDG